MDEKNNELTEYQIRHINILTHLYENDAVTDDIVELLRLSELDYFSLIEKYKILDKKVNIDEKTNILKFKNDYLTNIIKTAIIIKNILVLLDEQYKKPEQQIY